MEEDLFSTESLFYNEIPTPQPLIENRVLSFYMRKHTPTINRKEYPCKEVLGRIHSTVLHYALCDN